MRQISVGNNLTAATKTTVYTVPTGYYALWNLCYVVNHSGNNKKVDVFWYDKSTNVEIKVLDNKLNLEFLDLMPVKENAIVQDTLQEEN